MGFTHNAAAPTARRRHPQACLILAASNRRASPAPPFPTAYSLTLTRPHSLAHVPGEPYTGVEFTRGICGVSIIRSGEAMENALRECCQGIKIGKVLVMR